MNDLVNVILEQISQRAIDKKTGMMLLKTLSSIQEGHDIAIIGMAGRFPGADSIDDFWDNLISGKDCIGPLPRLRIWDCEDLCDGSNIDTGNGFAHGGYLKHIDHFDYHFFHLSPNEAICMEPAQRIFMETVYHVFEDAGYSGSRMKEKSVGIYAGYNGWSIYSRMISMNQLNQYSDAFLGSLSSLLAARMSYFMDLKGPAVTFDTACSSSLYSVHAACCALRSGDCDMAVAGGANIRLLPFLMENAYQLDAKDGYTKTFDDRADGTAWGEGVAAVLLKPLHKAIKDGDKIYAVISKSAINQDGKTASITAPNRDSQKEMLIKAWDSKASAEALTMIEAHGTGTQLGDAIEIEAITSAMKHYSKKKQFCAIGSVKTNIGHLDGASGITGLIKAVLSTKYRQIPPSLHFELPNQHIDFINSPVYVNTELSQVEESEHFKAGVSSFGMSGTNCHVVVDEFIPSSAKEVIVAPNIFTLSAKTKESLEELLVQYRKSIFKLKELSIGDICYTAAAGRSHFEYRLVFIVQSIEKFVEIISDIQLNEKLPMGVYYGQSPYIYGTSDSKMKGKKDKLDQEAKLIIEKMSESYDASDLEKLCVLYVKGAFIDWEKIVQGQIVSLPVYQFEKIRCWHTFSDEFKNKYFFKTRWEESPISNPCELSGKISIVIISRDQNWNTDMIRIFENDKITVTSVIIDHDEYDFEELFNKLPVFDKIIFKHEEENDPKNINEINSKLEKGLYTFVRLIKGLNKKLASYVELFLVINNAHSAIWNDKVYPLNTSLSGMAKVINQESVYIKCRCVDIERSTLPNVLEREILFPFDQYAVVYRNNIRYVEVLDKFNVEKITSHPKALSEKGVYVVTGGFGGIGLELIRYLSEISPAHYALISRRKVPDESEWENILAENKDKTLCRKIRILKEIRRQGSTYSFYQADVSVQEQMSALFHHLRKEYGSINGVIHSAGIASNGLLVNKDYKKISETLKAKIHGTWILDNETKSDSLEFFIMCSSGSSVFGDAGHGDYMAANAYLDAFTTYRRNQNKPALTINWTGWKEIGMAVDHGVNVDATFKSIFTEDAVRAFHYLFHRDIDRAMVGEINYDSENIKDLSKIYLPFTLSKPLQDIFSKQEKTSTHTAENGSEITCSIMGRESGIYTDLEKEMANIWGKTLGYDQIDINDNFFELGGDSIKAVQVIIQCKNFEIPQDSLYQYPSFESFCIFLIKNPKVTSERRDLSGIDRVEENVQLPMKYFIKNMTPFSGVFFKDCFYNALFAAFNHFKRDIRPFLINDVTRYLLYKDSVGEKLKIEFLSRLPIETIAQNTGIHLRPEENIHDIVPRICTAISQNMPVILRVDCFYEPIRLDMYQKTHWSHTLLIFGYDSSKSEFHVFEQENLNSLIYKHKTLSYHDVSLAYKGYLENFQKLEKHPAFITVEDEGGVNNNGQDQFALQYIDNIKHNEDQIIVGFSDLDRFASSFVSLFNTQPQNHENMLNGFIQILKAKQAEKFKLENLGNEISDKQEDLIDSIVKTYKSIVSSISIQIERNDLNLNDIKSIESKLDHIRKWEREYYQNYFDLR